MAAEFIPIGRDKLQLALAPQRRDAVLRLARDLRPEKPGLPRRLGLLEDRPGDQRGLEMTTAALAQAGSGDFAVADVPKGSIAEPWGVNRLW
jgi:hypothetical protein